MRLKGAKYVIGSLIVLVVAVLLYRSNIDKREEQVSATPESLSSPQAKATPSSSSVPFLAQSEDWMYLEPRFKVVVHPDIVYQTKPNFREETETLAFDLYEPEGDDHPQRPVVVFLHGGGYSAGDKRDGAEIANEWASRGFVVLSANYRLRANPFDDITGTLNDAMDDVKDVIGWVGEHETEFRLDKGRIALGGDSAGGSLSINFANEFLDSGNRNKYGIYAVLDIYGGLFYDTRNPELPPTMIVHGTKDRTVPYDLSVKLSQILEAQGVYHDFLTMEGIDHNYKNPKYWDAVIASTSHFMRNTMDRSQSLLRPETEYWSGSAGDTVVIRLERTKSRTDAAGSLRAALPAGWEQVGDAEFGSDSKVELSVKVPEETLPGVYNVLIEAKAEDASDTGTLSAYVKLDDPLIINFAPFYDPISKNIHTRASLINQSRSDQAGLLRLEFGTAEGSQLKEASIDPIAPGGTRVVELPFYMDGDQTVSFSNLKGRIVQKKDVLSNVLLAVPQAKPVAIDGSLKEWKGQSEFELNEEAQVKMQNWKGVEDLGGKGYVSWDDLNVYIGLDVTDDIHSQESSGGDIYQGDSLQFALNVTDSVGKELGTHEFGVALLKDGTVSNWRWISPDSSEPGKIEALKAAVSRKGNHTTYEIALPWSELGLSSPSIGTVAKFSLMLNDNDGEGRRGWIEYNGGIGYKDEEAFGTLILTGSRE
ncbi:alpha/beta hydrolase fold domain-containing protein [Cohnella mopanensis]|uniref:alpha/beta hydrolase fold domain-containing protein n=1 Tax=Cohnella mopanensis TaxID=2911966 RepID=UPI001EF833A1|nr:alpha/beta hydrolase fold domain-containing protein [Cohnella mopanensis]